uniref:Uncharacterized protein n=1 Tax=Caulerpa lentillifera TaxID=148947 RepID=A0A2Z2QKP0_9CHLO|nr:hypothetical protein [Caulerpa lentillifera]AST24278.1 hypothetical protein [Caulerpa lentillifera]
MCPPFGLSNRRGSSARLAARPWPFRRGPARRAGLKCPKGLKGLRPAERLERLERLACCWPFLVCEATKPRRASPLIKKILFFYFIKFIYYYYFPFFCEYLRFSANFNKIFHIRGSDALLPRRGFGKVGGWGIGARPSACFPSYGPQRGKLALALCLSAIRCPMAKAFACTDPKGSQLPVGSKGHNLAFPGERPSPTAGLFLRPPFLLLGDADKPFVLAFF